jgi:hypothetical protein
MEETSSFSISKYFHSLYTNLFDVDHTHKKPSVYHTIHSSHYSFSDETLNDIPDQEECPTLIDQALILNNTSSVMHPFESPLQFEFPEHGESQSDFDVPIFYDYFLVLELNERIDLSLIDPTQSDISDLDEHMLIYENIKYVEHPEFVDPYEQITTNEQPITTQNTRNIELIQEPLSSQYSLELHVTPRSRYITYPWILSYTPTLFT